MVLIPRAMAANIDFEQINARQMCIMQKPATRTLCIIDGYAPQSRRPTAEPYRFYDELENRYNTFNSNCSTILLRDFNARLHVRLYTETSIIGPYTFGRGEAFVQQQAPDTIEHREGFTPLCQGNGLCVTNTFFQNEGNSSCTYKETITEGFKEHWTLER